MTVPLFVDEGAAAATCVVVLARAPVRGFVKTRLAATIGPDGALAVYHQLLARTAAALAAWPGQVLVAHTGDPAAFGSWWASRERMPQPEGHLGVRIAAALRAGLARRPVAAVIGTDCPGIAAAELAAVARLAVAGTVGFGPCPDGGFWAIAARDRAVADVLERADVPWSSDATLAVAVARLAAAGLGSAHGPCLADCDTAADHAAAVAMGLLTATESRVG